MRQYESYRGARDEAGLVGLKPFQREQKQLENEFARRFSISPDGQWFVFERAKSAEEEKDIALWIARINGRDMRLLVRNAFAPSWGR